ncbi:hypothetical protein EYZ11_013009 [Aspergillus tanneri]|uniref:Uncharacterized protein n=1 Tax=Aspergillus tanneri TaxID=1220188 RepID=A0A4S3IZ09_9EURO|nr:hypothetical protein EYZ11_013009 [Aspergillus tanneri]
MSNLPNNHEIVSSFFIGPRAENIDIFKKNIDNILQSVLKARQNYYPNDGDFITPAIKGSQAFKAATEALCIAVNKAVNCLGIYSIPYWHPRYQGHMCMDLTMPALLGYFMTMIYNPNNVTIEASPFTTPIELEVGEQLCTMFGYNAPTRKPEPKPGIPLSWGHITCDGTVANLESIWVARNLKFYPLTLYLAMKEGPLTFIAEKFMVTTCRGEKKLFRDLGKDILEHEFRITNPPKYFLAQTRHYSWPKGGAIAGIGSANMQGVELDMEGRISLEALEQELNRCLEKRQAVYAVVAMIGTTEESAVDPVYNLLAMRQKFQEKGLSFLVHADAAWGGYFASMIPHELMAPGRDSRSDDGDKAVGIVPELPLRIDTITNMIALKEVDSITVDPHKAGYTPYPAGGLCYRDGRMRFLVTWTSPYLAQGSTDSIGIFGVEGSKPGAAAMGAWLSNTSIGLGKKGYGALLGEAAFTSARLSAYYAAMHYNKDGQKPYIMIPFNLLPKEKEGYGTLDPKVDEQRQEIWDKVLTKNNDEIRKCAKTMALLRELGSDLNINAFGINWCRSDGTINKDLEEANYLMQRVVNRLSITKTKQDPTKIPLFLTSTQFEPASYGKCAQSFMKRLQLTPCAQVLWVMRNVVMNPFPTDRDFINTLILQELEKVIIQEVNKIRERNNPEKRAITFLLRGGESNPPSSCKVYLDFQTCFHRATQRQQIILAAELDNKAYKWYIKSKKANPTEDFEFQSDERWNLEELIKTIEDGKPRDVKGKILTHVQPDQPCTVKMTKVVKSRPLNSANRDPNYPRNFMPFYLYGSPYECHIAHMLLQAPNVNLSACDVQLDEKLAKAVKNNLEKGLILTLTDYREETMQPFPAKNNLIGNDFFFRQGQKFQVDVYEDPNPTSAEGPGLLNGLRSPIASGTMTLGLDIHIDVETMNRDPYEDDNKTLPKEDGEALKMDAYPEGGFSWEECLEDIKKNLELPWNKKEE